MVHEVCPETHRRKESQDQLVQRDQREIVESQEPLAAQDLEVSLV